MKRPAEVMHRSQQLPEPLQRTGETSTQIERTQRRRIQKGERGHHPGQKGYSEGDSTVRSSKRIERLGTVWFAACRSVDCSPIAPWHQRHQPGTIFPIRGAPLRFASNSETAFYDEFATDFPTFKPLIRTALIKILSIKVLQELVQKRKISYFIAFIAFS